MANDQFWINGHPSTVIVGGGEQFWIDGHPVSQPLTAVGPGGITVPKPLVSGSGSVIFSGVGAITVRVPLVSGSGFTGYPYQEVSQYAVEDLETSDVANLELSQAAVEDLETLLPGGPQLLELSQIVAEDLEFLEHDGPQLLELSQYCVEILIPFTCDLTPLGVGCIVEPVPASEGVGCEVPGEDPAVGVGCRMAL